MSKDIKLKALKVIEGLTILYEDGRKTHKDAENILEEIYQYSHIALGSCKNKHENWIKQMEDMYKALKKDYI